MEPTSTKIITKPPNKGFQIRKQPKSTAEQEKALRDQLHIEIENKARACSNLTYECSLPRLDGFDYCMKHILQDPKAPYRQCAYIYSSNQKRCLQPAPKHENKKESGLTNYCFEHSRLAQLTKTRNAVGKYKESETTESFLNNLSHHIKIDKGKVSPGELDSSFEKETDLSNMTVDPFVDINTASTVEKGRKILDYASDSSSDDELPTMGNSWPEYDMDSSSNESIDSQYEDPLKHAGIYTTEEATMITKEKLIRLQALYIDQFQRLQHVLREKRRKYLHSLRRERETYCSIYNQTKDTPRERHLYEKLKALNQYHKRNGEEAILHKKYIEKRAKVTVGLLNKQPYHSKCAFSEGGVKCGANTIPCCKYCRKHILEDKKQILFRACSVEKSGVVCQEPVAAVFEDAACVLHIELHAQRSYIQKKYESDTEDDEQHQQPGNILKQEDATSCSTTYLETSVASVSNLSTMNISTTNTSSMDVDVQSDPEMKFDHQSTLDEESLNLNKTTNISEPDENQHKTIEDELEHMFNEN